MHYTSFVERKELKRMEIITVVPRGYCKGVVRAITLAKETAQKYPNQPITMLGMIVHNRHVVEACEHLGIHCVEEKGKTRLELLDKINEGIVIFTAHGVSDAVYQKAIQKGLTVVDASCDDVTKTQSIVKNYLKKDFDIIYIGKLNHPEAEAVLAISSRVHFVTNIHDINQLPLFNKVIVTNQTTMSIKEIANLIEECKTKYPHLIIHDEICNATRIRQEAIAKLENIDCLIVVGDPHSNNTLKLKEIADNSGIKNIFLVETSNDLSEEWIENCKRIAVTSGASTPTYLTNQVIESLKNYEKKGVLLKTPIDYDHLLD